MRPPSTRTRPTPKEHHLPQPSKRSRAPIEAALPSVDPTSAEDLLDCSGIGPRIRRLRLKRSMGLVDLGKLTGLSASFLSQLETGRVVPTLRNLARLAIVFEKDISYFFEALDTSVFRVQRSKDRVRLRMGSPETGYIAESFGILIPEGGVRPCMAEFLPGKDHIFRPEISAGVEMIYIVEGTLEVRRGSQTSLLHERDVLYIGSETHRSYRCASAHPTKALIISFDGERTPPRSSRKSSASG
jgi:transcriptional regulator with XRE-family HTH domain